MTTDTDTASDPVTATVDDAEAEPPAPSRARIGALLAAIVVALFAGHLWLSSSMDGALVSDGAAYLANARWLGGAGETWMGRNGFYHAGYSLLLAPLFAAFDDADRIFRGALVVNAALAACSFAVYWLLARRLGTTRTVAVFAGLVATLYPSVVLQASIEWSENVYHLGFAVLLLALHRLVTGRGDVVAGVATGVAGAFLYAVHPRALGVVPILALALAWFAWRRVTDRRAAVAGLAALVVAFALVRLGHGVLIDALWADDRAQTEGDVLGRLAEPALVKGLVLRLFGHSWYLLVASFGVVAAAVVWLARRWRSPFAQAVVAMCAGTMAAGALMMSDATRVDHFVYGRYNEGFLPALLVIGVAGLSELRRARHLVALLGADVAAVVGLAVLTVGTNGGERFAGAVMPLNVLGILAWESDRGHVDVALVSMIALGITAIVVLVRTRALLAALAAVALVFAGESVHAHDEVIEPWAAYWSSVTELPEAVEALPTDAPVVYQREGYDSYAGGFYQFELLDRIDGFWEPGEPAPAALVLTASPWPAADDVGARLIFQERTSNQGLWVLPGALADELDAAGFVVDGRLGDPLPVDALAAAITDVGDVDYRPGETVTLPVRVRHPAGGEPWPGLGDLATEAGSVRVIAQWEDGTLGTGDLPKMLLPGQSADVPVYVPVPATTGAHRLTITLLQIGTGAFRGGRVLTVDVG